MKIGIDFSRGEMEHRTGVEWYSYYIVKYVLDLGTEHEIVLYSRRGATAVSTPLRGGVPADSAGGVVRRLRWPFRFGWTQFRLSLEIFLHPPDVLFVPSHIVPPVTPKRVVTMVHDVAFRRHPEWYSKKHIQVLKLGMRRIIKKHAVVLVPTNFVKQELLELYPAMRELDIHVVHHGVDHELFHPRNEAFSSDSPYFLFVGRLETKKNISRIVGAFIEFVGVPSPNIGEGRVRYEGHSEYHLILVGRPGHGYEEFSHTLNHQNVHVIPSVSQEELVSLYQNAIALVFPTLYEGFGMPILEAMACGCPVITSQGDAHEEVAGDRAVLVDSSSVDDIAHGLGVLTDGDFRKSFIQKGLVRVREFLWDDAARKTMDILTKKI